MPDHVSATVSATEHRAIATRVCLEAHKLPKVVK